MNLLILFANSFPYNISEPFLEQEYPLYREYFDKVLIVTACKRGEVPTRQINDPSIEILQDYTLAKDFISIVEAIPWMLTDKMFYKEFWNLIVREGFSLDRFQYLVVFSLCGNHRARGAYRWMKKHPEYETAVLYSYWMHIPAYASVRLNQKFGNRFCTVSRAHGFDLYVERTKTKYAPFHKQMYDLLSEIAVISNHGKKYLLEKYGKCEKVTVRRLGVMALGNRSIQSDRKCLSIVSCSRIIPLKRLDRIVDALSRIQDHPIQWTHLGGGEMQKDLEHYAAEKLSENVNVTFLGTVPNTQVYEIYKKNSFHIFLNVSETEGVPVSVMEAMSFGIPVIATAVGGTSEVVDDGLNGYLLPKDFSDKELAAYIQALGEMPEKKYLSFCKNAQKKIELEYNAISNYRKFMECLVTKRRKNRK